MPPLVFGGVDWIFMSMSLIAFGVNRMIGGVISVFIGSDPENKRFYFITIDTLVVGRLLSHLGEFGLGWPWRTWQRVTLAELLA